MTGQVLEAMKTDVWVACGAIVRAWVRLTKPQAEEQRTTAGRLTDNDKASTASSSAYPPYRSTTLNPCAAPKATISALAYSAPYPTALSTNAVPVGNSASLASISSLDSIPKYSTARP